MALTVSWYVEHRIIKVAATGNISPEMVREMSRQVVALLDASSFPLVHTLWDMSAVEQYPKILSELQAVTRPYLSHPR
nr:hypothetical protein [Anaerolineae bacterium]